MVNYSMRELEGKCDKVEQTQRGSRELITDTIKTDHNIKGSKFKGYTINTGSKFLINIKC
jgi:hypothetical protein